MCGSIKVCWATGRHSVICHPKVLLQLYKQTSTGTLQRVSIKPYTWEDIGHQEKEYRQGGKEGAYRKEDGSVVIAVLLCQRGS